MMLVCAPLLVGAQERPDSVTTAEGGVYAELLSAKDSAGERFSTEKYFLRGYKDLRKPYGIWGEAMAKEKYLSWTAGPYLRFAKFFFVGAGVGPEFITSEPSETHVTLRYGSIFLFDNSRQHLEYYHEGGEGRDFFRAEYLGLADKAAAGFIAQADDGFGPLVRFSFRDFRVWGAKLWRGSHQGTFLLGIEFVRSTKTPTQ